MHFDVVKYNPAQIPVLLQFVYFFPAINLAECHTYLALCHIGQLLAQFIELVLIREIRNRQIVVWCIRYNEFQRARFSSGNQ